MSLRQVYEIERPLPPIIAQMERKGFKVDQDRLHALGDYLDARMADLDSGILADVPASSPQQLGVFLFEQLGLPNRGRTDKSGQWKTDEQTLEDVGREVSHPILDAILKKRELSKLKSTYVISLLRAADENSRVHTTLDQMGADTGRFSSYKPNLQNQPAPDDKLPHDQDFGWMLRSCFICEPGNLLVVCDHSQIEYRIIAAMSREPYLIDAFIKGIDIHQAVTNLLELDSRRQGKTLNFGVVYGLGVKALAGALGCSEARAQELWNLYWVRLPKVRKFIKESELAIQYFGYSETMFGRRNYLDIPENRWKRAATLRKGFNMRIQGTAADIIKMQMPMAHALAQAHHSDMLLQVHDELVFEAPEAEAEALMKAIQESGRRVADIGVPLEMSGGIGKNWAEAK